MLPNVRYCWNPPVERDNSKPYDGFHLDTMPTLLTEGPKARRRRG